MGAKTWEKIQNYAFVTVITVLIWFYALNEAVKPYDLRLNIQFVPPAGQELLIEPAAPQVIAVRFRANAGQHNEIMEIKRSGRALPIEVSPAPSGQPRQTIDPAQELARLETIKRIGLLDLETQPPSLTVRVEPIEPIPGRPVRLGDTGRRLVDTTIDPPKATIYAPATLADRLADQHVLASLSQRALDGLEENLAHSLQAELLLPPEALADIPTELQRYIRIEPARVMVSFTLRATTDKITLQTLPVGLAFSSDGFNRFNVQLAAEDQFIADVQLIGPAEAIERIRNDPSLVRAEVRLSIVELEELADTPGPHPVAPNLTAPAGVMLNAGPLESVSIRVSRRQTPGGP